MRPKRLTVAQQAEYELLDYRRAEHYTGRCKTCHLPITRWQWYGKVDDRTYYHVDCGPALRKRIKAKAQEFLLYKRWLENRRQSLMEARTDLQAYRATGKVT